MIRTVFWFFVLFLALSFFGISIQSIVDSPAGQANIDYIVSLAILFWQWLVAFANTLPNFSLPTYQ